MNRKRMTKWFVPVVVAVLALAAAGARAGDSAPMVLDTREGTRIARETEPIAYSTAWSRGADVQVFVGGVPLKEAPAPATGTVVWNAAEAGPGHHTLTHVSGGVTLTAQFAVFGAQVESADPAKGSIKLAWTDLGSGVTYSVYRGAGESRAAAECVAPGLTETTWTDNDYWCAEPVLKPLNYWVVADGGGYGERVSEPVETRRRYGVFLGLAEYDPKFNEERIQNLNEAMKLRELFVERGGMESSRAKLLRNSEANWGNVKNELQTKADESQPGDLFVLYIPTHGGYANGEAKVMFYDCITNMIAIFKVLEAFDSGTIVIPIIKACHSGAFAEYASGTPDKSETEKVLDETSEWFKKFVEAGLAMCRGNMPILASCGAEERTLGVVTGSSYTDFGEAFIHQGWENGYADGKLQGVGYAGGDGDGYVSFLELIQYAQAFARGHSDALRSHVKWTEEHEQLLRSTLAGRAGTGSQSVPSAPDKIEATEGLFDLKIVVSWSGVANATRYWLYYLKDGRTGEDDEDWECLSYWTTSTARRHTVTLLGKSYLYRVRAVNGAGASGFSPIASGSRGTPLLLKWLLEQGLRLGLGGTAWEMAAMPSANGASLEACYVAGIDPTDPLAAFEAELVREDGKWKARPKGGEKEGRVYYVEAKKKMSDEDWTDVTDVEDLEAEGWRFFRVGVELAE